MSPEPVDLVVVGGGPGGYSAAFRAADLGLRTVLVERHSQLGGVCLHVGCIPSKTLLHAASVIDQAAHAATYGVTFPAPQIDVGALRAHSARVIEPLAGGLAGLAKKRGIRVIHATATFADAHTLTLDDPAEPDVAFRSAIIAVGSRPIELPDLPDDPRIIDSTGALQLDELPEHLVIVGGGIIGLEMATVYRALGVRVSVVELMDQLIPGCDRDLVTPLAKRLSDHGVQVHLSTRLESVRADATGLTLQVLSGADPVQMTADRLLVAVGRRPNGDRVGAERAGVIADERGFIAVDQSLRTNIAHIFAIGDVVGDPMLAHKASHQGRVAAEVAAGKNVRFDARVIPSVAYTDPEIAWVGITETEARADETPVEVAAIPWAASGRARALDRPEGRTKLLVDPTTRRILGAGIVGVGAGELIAEYALAIEMGAVAEDMALTIHPHPTLSETAGLAAEWAEGTITDLYRPPPATRSRQAD